MEWHGRARAESDKRYRRETATDTAGNDRTGGEGCATVNPPVDRIAPVESRQMEDDVGLIVIPRMTKRDGGSVGETGEICRVRR